MDLTSFMRRAIGVPFLEHGRDFDGWDCWGLIVLAYREVLGVTVPDFTYATARDYLKLARLFGDRNNPYWCKVDPRPMAVACIYRRGVVIHAGLVVPNRRILHVEDGVETCLQPVASFRVESYYAPDCCHASI